MKNLNILFSISLLFWLAGCNTIKGVGQDVQKAGSAIEKSMK